MSEIEHEWEQLPIAELHQFDAVCDRFERAIAADPDARIEPFIADFSQPQQLLLLRELLSLEIEHRQAVGASPDPDEYVKRFPQWADELRIVATHCLKELEQARVDGHETLDENRESRRTLEVKRADLQRQWSDQWQACSAAARSFGLPADGVLGHYQLQSVIGRGGMGLVVRARDERLDRDVAIKVLATTVSGDTAAHERFLREARAAAAVRHANVVTIYAVEIISEIPFLVMELVDGVTLDKYLQQTGKLETGEIVSLAAQIAEGLASAHRQGLIHRDIKPANILLERRARDVSDQQPHSPWHVRIADFGLARIAADRKLTNSGLIAGTPQYMSPEQANGKEIDVRSDLFSLGSVMYAMSAGEDAFQGESPLGVLRQVADHHPARTLRDISPQTPDWLADTIDRLMSKSPNDRFQSAGELARLLEQHLHNEQVDSSGVILKECDESSELQNWGDVLTAGAKIPSAIRNSETVGRFEPASRVNRRKPLTIVLFGVAIMALLVVWMNETTFRVASTHGRSSEVTSEEGSRTSFVASVSTLSTDADSAEARESGNSAEPSVTVDLEKAFTWPAEELWHGRIAAPDLSLSKSLYREDFDGPESTFKVGKSAGHEYGVDQGRYFISADPGLVGGAWLEEKTYANFACEVVGRVNVVNTQWFLNCTSATNDVTVRFHMNGLQGVEVSILNDGAPRVAQTIRHTAIHEGEEFNKLLVVAVGNRFEIFVNDVAICNPIVLKEIPPPARIALGAVANENPVRAEFESFAIWSAEDLPSAEERLATKQNDERVPARVSSEKVDSSIPADPAHAAP